MYLSTTIVIEVLNINSIPVAIFSFSILPLVVDVTVDVYLHQALALVAALALNGAGPKHSDKADDYHTNWDRQHCHLTI